MKKDVIIIIGGEVKVDGSLSLVTKNRVDEGVRLYRKGVAPRLIMTGAWEVDSRVVPDKTEAVAMKEYAARAGVPPDKIFLENEAMDVVGNAYLTKMNWLKKNNWKELVVIASDYLDERVEYVFDKILGPEYNVDYRMVDSGLAREVFNRKKQTANYLLEMTHSWLDPIAAGDDAAIKKFLEEDNPAYYGKN